MGLNAHPCDEAARSVSQIPGAIEENRKGGISLSAQGGGWK